MAGVARPGETGRGRNWSGRAGSERLGWALRGVARRSGAGIGPDRNGRIGQDRKGRGAVDCDMVRQERQDRIGEAGTGAAMLGWVRKPTERGAMNDRNINILRAVLGGKKFAALAQELSLSVTRVRVIFIREFRRFFPELWKEGKRDERGPSISWIRKNVSSIDCPPKSKRQIECDRITREIFREEKKRQSQQDQARRFLYHRYSSISTLPWKAQQDILDMQFDLIRCRDEAAYKIQSLNDAISYHLQFRDRAAYLAKEAEKRKTIYMNEANGMRVERQVIRLMLLDIYKEFDSLVDPHKGRKMELERNFKELLDMLQKDPERH